MTPEAINIAVAEACGTADRWVLIKRGLYYRPNRHGYTNNISEAWVLTEAEADKHTYPYDAPVKKQRAPVLNYFASLDAMHEAEKVLIKDDEKFACSSRPYDYPTIKYKQVLRAITGAKLKEETIVSGEKQNGTPRFLSTYVYASPWEDMKLVHATAAQRAEAFLRTKGLWRE